MKICKIFIFILFFLSGIYCYSRDNANIILVVDHSTSMIDYFEEVKQYIVNDVIPILNRSDYFFYIEFGEGASVNHSDEIENIFTQRLIIQSEVKLYRATHNYTDIGLALETMFSTLEMVHDLNEKNILLFITDGRDNPPPESKYYVNDYAYQNAFYRKAEEIKKGPWKIMTLGIGEQTAAIDLSNMFDGEYVQVSDDFNSETLTERFEDFLGHFELFFEQDFSNLWIFGKDVFFKIESTYSNEKQLNIIGMELSDIMVKNGDEWEKAEYDFDLGEELTGEYLISPIEPLSGSFNIKLPDGFPDGTYRANLIIQTEKKGELLYKIFDITFNKFFPLWLLIILILIGIGLIAFVVWFLWERGII